MLSLRYFKNKVQLRNFSLQNCPGSAAIEQVTHWSKYARFNDAEKRREDWFESVQRSENMFLEKYPFLSDKINWAFDKVREKKILPSMRCLQFAGQAALVNNARVYNCCYAPIQDVKVFSEIMFLLLSGCGVGYSVQPHHVENLPHVRMTRANMRETYIIEDTIEGWAKAVDILFSAYLEVPDSAMETIPGARPVFEYGKIRPEGSPLVTSGGYAPGSDGLRKSLTAAEKILQALTPGAKLTPLQCHDLICHLSEAVMSGGVRRSSLISLFSTDDSEMMNCKSGSEWFVQQSQRRYSNNSAVVHRDSHFEHEFQKIWDSLSTSGSGEPGIFQTNNSEVGTNPCAEISLEPYTFCNLTEINATDITTQSEFEHRAIAAAFIGTLQAGFIDFPFISQRWTDNTRRDSLIGVGITGIASGALNNLNLSAAAQKVKEENGLTSGIIGIEPAARCTTVKPSGTTSIILGCTSSGIHAWHNPHFIRRISVKKSDPLYFYAKEKIPSFVEDSLYDDYSAFLAFPIKAPENQHTVFRHSETANEFLDRVKRYNVEWIKAGHRRGANSNNVSATLSVKNDEWETVHQWMIRNKEDYNALALLPYNDHSYPQTPFEDISEELYLHLSEVFASQSKDFDLTDIREDFDNTVPLAESACSGPLCEINL